MENQRRVEDFLNFIMESDLEFCKKYLEHLSDEERELFLKDNDEGCLE